MHRGQQALHNRLAERLAASSAHSRPAQSEQAFPWYSKLAPFRSCEGVSWATFDQLVL
jgi:hypothetical protein